MNRDRESKKKKLQGSKEKTNCIRITEKNCHDNFC